MLRRTVAIGGLVVTVFLSLWTPAPAAYCGPPATTTTLEKLSITTYPGPHYPKYHSIDATYVRMIDVHDGYAMSMTEEDRGPIFYFWFLSDRGWVYVPTLGPPASWPTQVRQHFNNDINADPMRCLNPAFIPRGGG
ncbi:MAG TPA: hypothetical protein VMV82_09720 [Candidatus Dormibacteraeota bacterium]|nr:hypothetical protein [Candidatus Dormibacteraeota bacterium]